MKCNRDCQECGESEWFWLGVLTKIKNRDVKEVCIFVCDDPAGLPESINTTREYLTVQIPELRPREPPHYLPHERD